MIPQSPSISSAYARALTRSVSEAGHDIAEFLQPEGITEAELESSAEINAAVFGRLYQKAILVLEDESLGLVSGGRMPTGTFRMMCLCVIHRPNLASIVRRAGEFFDVCKSVAVKPDIITVNETQGITFATVDDEQRTIEQILVQEGPVRIRSSLYMWHSLLSWFAGKRLPLCEVIFNFSEPAKGADWSDLFGCPVRFDGLHSMLCFDADVLKLPNVQNEQSLSVFLKSAPYRLITPSFNDHRLSDSVLALFGDDFTRSLPSAEEVGKLLGVSVSTLRRQLREEGTSFQQLKDDCRRAAAVHYLSADVLSLSDIAGLLGFDEPSAFFRAFKRWTGSTPSEYRANL